MYSSLQNYGEKILRLSIFDPGVLEISLISFFLATSRVRRRFLPLTTVSSCLPIRLQRLLSGVAPVPRPQLPGAVPPGHHQPGNQANLCVPCRNSFQFFIVEFCFQSAAELVTSVLKAFLKGRCHRLQFLFVPYTGKRVGMRPN